MMPRSLIMMGVFTLGPFQQEDAVVMSEHDPHWLE